MKKTTNAKNTRYPHVKWGHLVAAIVIASTALALIGLNLTKTILGMEVIDIFIAYGPLIAFVLLVISLGLFSEDFLPSLKKFKAYKAKVDYQEAVDAAIRESCLVSYHIQEERYQDFLKENPKYRIL